MATICDLNLNKKQPDISYPCHREYKVIFSSDSNPEEIIKDILKDREYKISPSKKSKKGNYKSYNITVFVTCDDEYKAIFTTLKSHQSIKYVL